MVIDETFDDGKTIAPLEGYFDMEVEKTSRGQYQVTFEEYLCPLL